MTEMVKVLQIGMTKNWGGLETYLLQQFDNIDINKIEYDFVNITGEYKIVEEEKIINSGSLIYNICSRHKNPLKHYWQWIQLLKKISKNYKAIVLNSNSLAYVFPLFIAKIYGIPVRIIHSHNAGYENEPGILRKILVAFNKILLNFSATDYWACSQKAGEWMFGKNRKFTIIHNAIDSKNYKFDSEKRDNLRKSLNIENKFVVGHVGRFAYQKNHEFLINVFYELQKIEPASVLMLVGSSVNDDEFLIKAKEQVKNLNIENKVLFLGMRNDVPDLMQAMDCFVFPSHFEGLPLVAIEAQCIGLKSYLSDVITNEVKITDLVDFISLKEAPKHWAKQILSNRNYIRKDMTDEIKKAGYDIKTEIKKIEKFYLEN